MKMQAYFDALVRRFERALKTTITLAAPLGWPSRQG
jgi:hypothetical protein